jgi:hypothetical protein
MLIFFLPLADSLSLHALRAGRCKHGAANARSDIVLSEDSFYFDVLSRRVAAMQANEADAQCIVLDAMVPRQRLELRIGPPFIEPLQKIKQVGGHLCMLGVDPRTQSVLRTGVEARIESLTSVTTLSGFYEMVLIGGRRFSVLNTTSSSWPPSERLFDARVGWLEELPCDEATIASAAALDPLVAEWTRLVVETGRERSPDQIKTLLADLGPMPDAEYPDDRALWVAALINPLPALGVAMEIRPATLEATSASERLEVAETGLLDSIARLKRPGPTF